MAKNVAIHTASCVYSRYK